MCKYKEELLREQHERDVRKVKRTRACGASRGVFVRV